MKEVKKQGKNQSGMWFFILEGVVPGQALSGDMHPVSVTIPQEY
jgi:hypothetical protein